MSEDEKAFIALKKAATIEIGDTVRFNSWEEAFKYYGRLGEGIVTQEFNKENKSKYANNFVITFKTQGINILEINLEVKTQEILLVRKGEIHGF